MIGRHPDHPDGYIVRACDPIDHHLPGRHQTIHYIIDHFGDRLELKSPLAKMRA